MSTTVLDRNTTSHTRLRGALEQIVIVAIVLVLIQSFLEDFAVVARWSAAARTALAVSGFVFDLFFSIEFLARSYDAWRRYSLREYIYHERGWVDFLASVPLLIFSSGPAVMALAAGGVTVAGLGRMLNVIKVVKAVRVARVLRLLRVIKVFRSIKNADSVMAKRHVAVLNTTAVTVVVFGLIIAGAIGAVTSLPTLESELLTRHDATAQYVAQSAGAEGALHAAAAFDPALLVVQERGITRYSRLDNAQYRHNFTLADYVYIESGRFGLFFDVRASSIVAARDNLTYFVVIVALVLVFMFVYSPHFAMTVSDPIHIMRRGMAEPSYNLEIVIPERYAEDDVYRLAALYNEEYLPLKDRAAETTESSGLTLDSFGNLFE